MSKDDMGSDELESKDQESTAPDEADSRIGGDAERADAGEQEQQEEPEEAAEEAEEAEEEEETEGWVRTEEIEEVPVLQRLTVWAAWVGVVCLVAAGTLYASKGAFNWWVKGLLIAAGILLIQFVVLRWPDIQRSLSLRSTRLTATSAATALLVIGILVLANYVASRHNARLDLTEKKRFTLSEQTLSILKDLKKDVKMAAIAGLANWQYERLQDLLKQYGHASPHIKWQILDPDADRASLEPYMDMRPTLGSTIVACGDRRELAYTADEEALTTAILKVTTEEKKKVYFLKGHGEKSIENYDDTGLSRAKRRLEKEQFEVEELVLAGKKSVPADADVVVIAGPQRDLLPAEVSALKKYLKDGGRLMVMLEPPPAPSLSEILSDYNVKVGDDLVWDVNQYRTGTEPVVAQYIQHDITRIPGYLALIRARSLETNNPTPPPQQPGMPPQPPPGPHAVALGMSSPFARALPPEPGGGFAKKGPTKQLTLAVAVSEEEPPPPPRAEKKEEKVKKKARLVVVGDSDFATNQLFKQPGLFNSDFFLNSIAWLAEQSKLVSIRPKERDIRYINLTKNQKILVFIIAIILVPLAVLSTGVVVWWKRRG